MASDHGVTQKKVISKTLKIILRFLKNIGDFKLVLFLF